WMLLPRTICSPRLRLSTSMVRTPYGRGSLAPRRVLPHPAARSLTPQQNVGPVPGSRSRGGEEAGAAEVRRRQGECVNSEEGRRCRCGSRARKGERSTGRVRGGGRRSASERGCAAPERPESRGRPGVRRVV